MNRSFRAQDSQMQGSALQQRQQLRASMMKEKDEELALFLEMRRREKERNDMLLSNSEEFDAPFESKSGTSSIFNIAPSLPARKTGTDEFLNTDIDKNDYDWLITPPGTPLFPSLEMESQKTVMSQIGTSKARPTNLRSRLASPQPEPAARSNLLSKQTASSPGLNSSSAGTRRPMSSGGTRSRPATPTGRPTLTSNSKPLRPSTPTSRATLPLTKTNVSVATKPATSATKPIASAIKPTLSATKTSSLTKPMVPTRSSTPLRTTARSSTPTARPSIPPPKPTSRTSTPTRRPTMPSTKPSASMFPVKSSSNATKPVATTSRNPAPSSVASPTVKSRPWKPSEMPGFSLDAPPNLRTTLPDRPLSASRGRPGPPSSRSSSVEPVSSGRPRRQSCSPSGRRIPNGIHASGSSVPAVSRGHSKVNDNVSPGLFGTQMVERLVNMRKLVPPKQDSKHSPHSNLSGKPSSSPDSSGFGRTLSKKSLDMAIRHMDIRRTIPGNLRPLMTNIPASSMYTVRSGPARSRTISVSDSPLATSSNASSEVSVNNNGLCLDGIELEDNSSERGGRSPANSRGR